MTAITITPANTKAERAQWVDYVYVANAADPNFVPQLRMEEIEKVTPGGNPFHEHADCQLLLAKRGGQIVGRIAAIIDHQATSQPVEQGMGPGTGNWGALEAETQEIANILIASAEDWLRVKGMTRVVAPMNLSVWEEPGLLVKGHDHPPTVMMGHQNAKFQPWIEAAGYTPAKMLNTYELDITRNSRRSSSASSNRAKRTRASTFAASTSRNLTRKPRSSSTSSTMRGATIGVLFPSPTAKWPIRARS
jgi:hypothetical protein